MFKTIVMTIPKRETKQIVSEQLKEQGISFEWSVDYEYSFSKNHFRGQFLAIKKGLSLMTTEKYLLLLEDDILVTKNFKAKIHQILKDTNHEIYSLMIVSDQLKSCPNGFLTAKSICWDQGFLIRKDVLEEYVDFVTKNYDQAKCKHGCDGISLFAIEKQYLFNIPVPTLVQHIDGVSMMKNSMFGKSRTSSNFVEDESVSYPKTYTKKKSAPSRSTLTYQLKNETNTNTANKPE